MNTESISYPQSKNEFLEDFFLIRKFSSDNLALVKKQGFFKTISEVDLNSAIKEINLELIKCLEKVENINEYFYSSSVQYSIEKFVEAEMDYSTPGIRGLGRMSTYIPRFGGLYSRYLQKISKEELNRIGNSIIEIIKDGYKTAIFLDMVSEQELKKLNKNDNESFFQKWVPQIYVSDLMETPTVSEFLDQSAWGGMVYFSLKISEETNFPKKYLTIKYARESKLSLIIARYVVAGFLLRFLEIKT